MTADEGFGVPVPEATMQRWAESALQIRANDWLLEKASVPEIEAPFGSLEVLYQRESISQWCREGLRSANDHMTVWANHAVPLQQHEGQVVRSHGFRWYFTLLRGAIEGAAQSGWLSSSATRDEAIARLLRLARHDVLEQSKAWKAMGRDATRVTERLGRLDADADAWGDPSARKPLPSMVSLIRSSAVALEADPDLLEAHWRTCSAAAHGKEWAVNELQVFAPEAHEWRPGQYLRSGHLDPDRWTTMLGDVLDFESRAIVSFLQRTSTLDIGDMLREAFWAAAKGTPQRDGGAHLARIGEELGLG